MSAAPMVAEALAPAVLRIDVAEVARVTALPAMQAAPLGHTAMSLMLLREAEKCAAGDGAAVPRRELVRAAIEDRDREVWYRDLAESQALELTNQRRQLLQMHFELVAWAAEQLGCEPSSERVLEHIRRTRVVSAAEETEMLPGQRLGPAGSPGGAQLGDGTAARIRADVAHG